MARSSEGNTGTSVVSERPVESQRAEGVPPPELSVVVVTYNEEGRIRDCLDSVFRACEGLGTFEVVLVDSNSTDRTVDIASEFPVTVLRITDDELTSPAAGRFVGTARARGDSILFVDGDMTINRQWLSEALSYLQEHHDVAAVDGHLNEPDPTGKARPMDAVRGVALYDADALATVGGFDPFLRSLEDIYLGFELTVAGYDLYRLPSVAAEHPKRSPVTDPIRRWRLGYMDGTGQAIRKSLGKPHILAKVLGRLRYKLILSGWLVAGGLSALSLPFFSIWLVLSALGFGVVSSRLGVGGSLYFFFAKFVGILGMFRGLSIEPREPEQFPLDAVQTVKRGTVQSGPEAPRGDGEPSERKTDS